MIPMQITYTEYQRAEQPIADFITHLLLVIKKIASPFVLEYRQWGYETDISSKEKLIPLPIAYPTTGLSLAVAVTDWETLCSTDSLTAVNFRYRGNKEGLPNIRWISLGY